ncbi:MAG: family 10 glycosylhydrolase, partial [Planctomycetota bacterium]
MILVATTVFIGCPMLSADETTPPAKREVTTPPPLPREFRGAWVATVANIDWPSKRTLSVEQQQAELRTIVQKGAELNLNALIFQVRPACDALYESKLEPWSEYLTGQMGKPPKSDYDPLRLIIELAHARGIEVHAWFNPYRALHPAGKGTVSDDHISRTHPEIVREYGKYLWLDPGEPAAIDHTLAVIMDVVDRYDVDGIHIDDYF